jgi:hypothetical protein
MRDEKGSFYSVRVGTIRKPEIPKHVEGMLDNARQ